MKASPKRFNLRWLTLLLFAIGVSGAHAEEPTQGRLLYVGDDDWDWASPLGAEKLSTLSRYGKMSWSGLDWAEEGLEEVRGVLFGTPPNPETLEYLSEMRGERIAYEVHPPVAGSIEKILGGEAPPNLIILMQNKGSGAVKLEDENAATLMDFVKGGGRLVVLDDWRKYLPMLDAAVEAALEHPPLKKEPAPKEEVPKLDPEPIKKLVGDLAADEFTVREAAKIKLIKLGPGIFDHIEIASIKDIGVRVALIRIQTAMTPKKTYPIRPEDTDNFRAYQREIDRITAVSDQLSAADIEHKIDQVLVNKNGWPLPALMLKFDPE